MNPANFLKLVLVGMLTKHSGTAQPNTKLLPENGTSLQTKEVLGKCLLAILTPTSQKCLKEKKNYFTT